MWSPCTPQECSGVFRWHSTSSPLRGCAAFQELASLGVISVCGPWIFGFLLPSLDTAGRTVGDEGARLSCHCVCTPVCACLSCLTPLCCGRLECAVHWLKQQLPGEGWMPCIDPRSSVPHVRGVVDEWRGLSSF